VIHPLVRELAPEDIPVAVTCRVLRFPPQASYEWCANPVSQRDQDDAHLINAAYDMHADDPASGYRVIADQLRDPRPVTPALRRGRVLSVWVSHLLEPW
jgi:hypothetical protein